MNEDNLHQAGVSGNHTTNGIPHGSTSLTPFLAVTGATDAVEFYRSVFGARLVDATEINGIVVHAELDFGNGKLQLGDPSPDYGLVPAPSGTGRCYSLGLHCADVDATVKRAGPAGGHLRQATGSLGSG